MRRWLLSAIFCLSASSVWARYDAAILKDYSGAYQESFIAQHDRVRLLAKQAQVEISARLGLIQYREGFENPLLIRFEDGAPPGIEHALAYVRLTTGPKGIFQELVINLSATERYEKEFDAIFFHEMTHAVMNDAVGGDAAAKIPHWVQEGLAQFVSEEGMSRVKRAANGYRKSQAHALVVPLDGPYTGFSYPQYFLAIEGMRELYSINAVQAMVRNFIKGLSTEDAVQDATGRSWLDFQKDIRNYSLKIFTEYARPDLE